MQILILDKKFTVVYGLRNWLQETRHAYRILGKAALPVANGEFSPLGGAVLVVGCG